MILETGNIYYNIREDYILYLEDIVIHRVTLDLKWKMLNKSLPMDNNNMDLSRFNIINNKKVKYLDNSNHLRFIGKPTKLTSLLYKL